MIPKLNIGDKVRVRFETGNTLTGTVTSDTIGGGYVASFGRGEDKFTSVIRFVSWGGKASWKESALE